LQGKEGKELFDGTVKASLMGLGAGAIGGGMGQLGGWAGKELTMKLSKEASE
jgi:hypothetical protein